MRARPATASAGRRGLRAWRFACRCSWTCILPDVLHDRIARERQVHLDVVVAELVAALRAVGPLLAALVVAAVVAEERRGVHTRGFVALDRQRARMRVLVTGRKHHERR